MKKNNKNPEVKNRKNNKKYIKLKSGQKPSGLYPIVDCDHTSRRQDMCEQ